MGNALWVQAKRQSGTQADELYRSAGEKYAEALKIAPNMSRALLNFGTVLSERAKGKSGTEADELYRRPAISSPPALRSSRTTTKYSTTGQLAIGTSEGQADPQANQLYRQPGEVRRGT
jgi:Tfp pilus assembly protein PilF